MNLTDICKVDFANAVSSTAGRKIPWDEPGFSKRMLAEHLTQDHDLASRKQVSIDEHVAWIQSNMLTRGPAKILDLGCGPGFYAERLAALGHTVEAMDFSPASIEYAVENSTHKNACNYRHDDIRTADYGDLYDAVLLVFGEFNVFSKDEAREILKKMYASLKPGGQLLIEATRFEVIEGIGTAGPSWYAVGSGLFSDNPHIVLMSNRWDTDSSFADQQFTVIEAETSVVESYRSVTQAYTEKEFLDMLTVVGFAACDVIPAWGKEDDTFMLLKAIKSR